MRWLKAAGIRAMRTMAQTTVALVGTNLIFDADWRVIIAASVSAGVLSLLTCVAGLPELEDR